jgi:hypothetical protein
MTILQRTRRLAAANDGGTQSPRWRKIPRTTISSPSPTTTSTASSRPRRSIRSPIGRRPRSAAPGATAVKATGSQAGVDARTTSTAMLRIKFGAPLVPLPRPLGLARPRPGDRGLRGTLWYCRVPRDLRGAESLGSLRCDRTLLSSIRARTQCSGVRARGLVITGSAVRVWRSRLVRSAASAPGKQLDVGMA